MGSFFIIISILGLAYFLLAKRRFDWFAVAFFSACIYFIPGFFGYASYLSLNGWIDNPLNDEAYGIMILVEGAILWGAIASDLFSKEFRIRKIEKGNVYVLNTLLCLSLIGFVLMLLTTGEALFYDKQLMMVELNRSHVLFYTAIMIGAIMSFEYKKWTTFTFFCVLIMFDLFIGFRTSFAITVIGIFTLWLSKQGRRRLLISSWRQIIIGVVLVVFLSFYQQIAYATKIGDLNLLSSLLSDVDTYVAMIKNSEPFITQSTLNDVTGHNYSVGMSHLTGILYQFTLFAPELGLESGSFNDLFQNELFPDVTIGMANNIWAEMWSTGGWALLVVFTVVFVIVLKLMTILTERSGNMTHRAFVAVMAAYWAFFIHRNDISYEIALEKQVLLVMILCFIITTLIMEFRKILRYPNQP